MTLRDLARMRTFKAIARADTTPLKSARAAEPPGSQSISQNR